MVTKKPQVTSLGEGRFCKLGIHIEVIILNTFLRIFSKQVLQFFRLKTGERDIKVCTLQVSNEEGQLVVIPFTTDFVKCNIQSFFFLFIHFDDDAFHFGDAHIDENLQSLMTTNDTRSGGVPDDRLHISELLDGAFQFFIFFVTGLQILTRIIIRRKKLRDVFLFNLHGIPP